MRLSLACIVVSALPLQACGADPDRANVFVQRDSAGIRIAESRTPQWPEGGGWRLAQPPSLEIGRVDGDEAYLFARIRGLRRLSDGRIAVANSTSDEIRLFGPDGRHTGTLGRAGDGPGEFRNIEALYRLPDDSLAVISSFGNRYTTFDANGTLGSVRSGISPFGRFADGSWLSMRYAQIFDPGTTGFVRDSIVFILVTTALTSPEERARLEGVLNRAAMEAFVADTIVTVPGNEEFRQEMMLGTSRGISNSPVPFGHRVSFTTYGNALAWGDGATFEIRITDPAGGPDRIVRLLEPNPPLSDEAIEAWKEYRRSRSVNESQRRRVEEMIEAQSFPERTPAYSAMMVDAAGNLWVERYRLATDDEQRWAVFDPDGQYLGTVRTPARFTIHEIGSDGVLGVWLNDEDVEIVRMYDLLTMDGGDAGN